MLPESPFKVSLLHGYVHSFHFCALLAPGNAAVGKGFTATSLTTANTSVVPSTCFSGGNSESTTTVPKAYINYIFFDEQFKYAGGNFCHVGTSGTVKDHWQTDGQLQNINVLLFAICNRK